MTREEFAATVLAAVMGVISYEYKRYRFWRSWSSGLVLTAFGALVVLNGGLGYLAALGANAANWIPASKSAWLANGAIIAGVSQAAPRTLLRGTGSHSVKGPSTAMGKLLHWLEGALDVVTKDAVHRYVVYELNDSARIENASLILVSEIQPDSSIPDELKSELKANLNQAAGALKGAGGDPDIARGQINGFLIKEIVDRLLKSVR